MTEKLDRLATDVAEIKADLREHMRRTAVLEQAVLPLLKEQALREGLIARTKERWKTGGMFIGIVAALAEIIRAFRH